MNSPLDIEVIRADFDAASRKSHLAEIWFYEYGHRLLAELKRLQALELESKQSKIEPPKLSRRD